MHSFTYSHVTEYTGWASPPVQPLLDLLESSSFLRPQSLHSLYSACRDAFPSTPSAARCFHSTLHPLSPSSVTPSLHSGERSLGTKRAEMARSCFPPAHDDHCASWRLLEAVGNVTNSVGTCRKGAGHAALPRGQTQQTATELVHGCIS